eukprot:CAMPEP_0173103754 /NCGR_PEP_ID=MMETSP1102-20130122/38622_1 /TAXON_ID=49646 /ORGANISM="Geminigera sp., Strain Caron Lab Isolate" /LENGTH=84 /DNA_ID=CAMNT_0013998717 /DNA_START=1148 /DNA_END=1403 /DNA_ORIENTATION=+
MPDNIGALLKVVLDKLGEGLEASQCPNLVFAHNFATRPSDAGAEPLKDSRMSSTWVEFIAAEACRCRSWRAAAERADCGGMKRL